MTTIRHLENGMARENLVPVEAARRDGRLRGRSPVLGDREEDGDTEGLMPLGVEVRFDDLGGKMRSLTAVTGTARKQSQQGGCSCNSEGRGVTSVSTW
jgi:hypothetical protein